MHSCLQIYEVLRNIFSALNNYEDITLDLQQPSGANDVDVRRQTLARLARTCRTFSEHALDVLWAHIDTLSPVVACLLKHVWSRHRRGLRLNGRVLISRWRGIEKYLTRVRALGKLERSVMYMGDISQELTHTLCSHPWPFLLPRLEKLFWSDSSHGSTHLLSNLLSPTLTELHLHAMGNPFMCSVISNLGVTCPLMKSFSTTGQDPAASIPVSTAVVYG
ncbi:hypothetical protein BDR05DRAFT_412918 [Suillus weaverae]|nr:hypothetical protein BDR05DRAFT_412918 [Suillus weaverae]